jgi:hypothetical protein
MKMENNKSIKASYDTVRTRATHVQSKEECHLLEYKNPVCTSQETPYVSTTESSQLKLCKI